MYKFIMMKIMQQKIIIILVLILSIFLACTEYEDITIRELPLDTIQTGEYIGEYNATLVKAKVKVYIKDNVIQSIDILEHQCGRGEKAEVIINDVIQKNSLQVDAVTGATYSSKVILKAIERAVIQNK